MTEFRDRLLEKREALVEDLHWMMAGEETMAGIQRRTGKSLASLAKFTERHAKDLFPAFAIEVQKVRTEKARRKKET